MTETFFKDRPSPTPEMLAKAAKLREKAAGALRREEESFQRSDTDGFLSQWALSIGAQEDIENAKILEGGGVAPFPVLCDAEGNVIATTIYTFQDKYAPWKKVGRWKLPDDLAEKAGRKWIPTAGYSGKSRIQKQLGLHQETRYFPAVAVISGSGTGLSGCASAYVAIVKKKD